MSKKKDKENKKSIRKAIEILIEGSRIGLIEVPRFMPNDKDTIEKSVYKEIFHVVKGARSTRLRNFLIGLFLYPSHVRRSIKSDFNDINWACKYLRRNKKPLRKYIEGMKYVFLFDCVPSWFYYKSGSNLKKKIDSDGKPSARKRDGSYKILPQYDFARDSFYPDKLDTKVVSKENVEDLKAKIEAIAKAHLLKKDPKKP